MALTATITTPSTALLMSGRALTPTVRVVSTEAVDKTVVVRFKIGPVTDLVFAYDQTSAATTVPHGSYIDISLAAWTVPLLEVGAVSAVVTVHDNEGTLLQTLSAVYTPAIVDSAYILSTFCQNIDQTKLPPAADWGHRILVAQRDLERAIGIASFGLTTVTERHDYTLQDFATTFWALQPRRLPVHSVTSYGMYWGDNQLIGSFETDWLVVDRDAGTIELVPNALGTTGLLYTSVINGLTTIIPGFAMYNRIPLAFRLVYKAGLDYDHVAADVQASYAYGIGRRALLAVLAFAKPRGLSNESISIDGASQSQGFAKGMEFGGLIAQLQQEEVEWIGQLRKEFGLELSMVVV